MTGEDFARWFLALYFTGVAVFYTSTILIKKHRHGNSPVTVGERGSKHRWIHRSFSLCRVAIWAACVARVPFPAIDRWLVPIPPLWDGRLMVAGAILLAASFAAIVAIHASIGDEWRSGIEPHGPARLITAGPFAFSRNPMFLCVLTAQIGFLLALPTVFALVLLAVGATALQAQVHLEEAHLRQRFADEYQTYQSRTRRWL